MDAEELRLCRDGRALLLSSTTGESHTLLGVAGVESFPPALISSFLKMAFILLRVEPALVWPARTASFS